MHHFGTLDVLAIVGIVAFVVYGCVVFKTSNAHDYYQFWVVGHALGTLEVSDIYSIPDRVRVGRHYLEKSRVGSPTFRRAAHDRRTLEPAGTPTLYALFHVFSTGDYDTDYLAFRLLSFVGFTLSVVSLCTLLSYPPLLTLLLLVTLTHGSAGFLADVQDGNVNQLQLSFVTLSLWLRQRRSAPLVFLNGFLWGMACLFKPNVTVCLFLLLVAALFAGQRRRLALEGTGFLCGVVLAAVIPIVMFGPACSWSRWFTFFRALNERHAFIDYTFPAMLLGTRDRSMFIALGALLTMSTVLVMWGSRSSGARPEARHDATHDLSLIALGLTIYVFAGTLVHVHYIVLLYPLALIALRHEPSVGAGWVSVVTMRRLVAVVTLVHLTALTLVPSVPDVASYRMKAFLYFMVLFVFVLLDLHRQRVLTART